MAERLGRYSLTLSPEDARAMEAYADADDVPYARWCANVVRREIRRLQSGLESHSLTQPELDALNLVREVLRVAPASFKDAVSVLVALRDSPSARPRVEAFASTLNASSPDARARRKR